MKLLFTLPNFVTAGSGREMFNIIERLSLHHDIYICIQKSSAESHLECEIRSKGYKILVHKFKFRGSFSFLEFVKAIIFFRKFSFDIWQSFDWSGDYLEAVLAKAAGAKYVYVKKSMNWGRHWRLKSYLSDAIIARNSTMMEVFFNGGLLNGKTTWITGAVDEKEFAPVGQFDSAVWRDQFIVACIANVIPVKGQDVLIRALARCPSNFVVWIVGRPSDKTYYDELVSLANAMNLASRVLFYGPTRDVPSVLRMVDVYVLPTTLLGGHEEGCPVSLIEAISSGVASIATDVAGSRDIISDGVNGYLVEPGNEEELAEKLEYLYKNPAVRMEFATRGRERVISRHRLDQEARNVQNLYERLCD